MKQPNYRTPGSGAVSFAAQYAKGMIRAQALPVIVQLMAGELHDQSDKRIKRCNYCGYWWRDDSLRNTKRTCSPECKTKVKSLQQAERRADHALLNPKPKKPSHLEQYYVWWIEYPFWIDDYQMLKHTWKYESMKSNAKIEHIEAAKKRGEAMGGRKKPNYQVPYGGGEKDDQAVKLHKVSLRLPKSDRESGEVKSFNIDNVNAYLREKYSEEKLQLEAKRAKRQRDFKWLQ
ncbi:hypothetical protein [Halalkalibacter flavus]|uniref:hypothetical protein n=1 Tax=Halalkalibacter flavus TaxID=3090668 RepID=UPI002FCB5EB0